MIISAKVIKKARKQRRCKTCGHFITGWTIRLYGSAHSSDPKYTTYIHLKCAGTYNPERLKIGDAIVKELKKDRKLANIPDLELIQIALGMMT